MIVANFSELRADLKKFLDLVENENEVLVLKRSRGKGAVLLSLAEYNSMMETMHLLKSKANATRLHESLQQSHDNNFAANFDVDDI